MRRLDVDAIVIAKTQINLSLLLNSKAVQDDLFRADHHVDAMQNSSNNLTGRRKQCGAILSVCNDLSKHSDASGKDITGLGRWVYS